MYGISASREYNILLVNQTLPKIMSLLPQKDTRGQEKLIEVNLIFLIKNDDLAA